MPMALSKCIQCGGRVSSEAKTCPKCGLFPHPHQTDPPDLLTYTAADQFMCPDCKTELSPRSPGFKYEGMELTRIAYDQCCPTCGRPFQTYPCNHCAKPVFKGRGIEVKYSWGKAYYHHACHSIAPTLPDARKPTAIPVWVWWVLAGGALFFLLSHR